MTTSGIGGLFNDPNQYGWSLTNDSTQIQGRIEQAQKNNTQIGTSQNLVLAFSGDTVSLPVIAGHIGFQEALPSQPYLSKPTLQFRQGVDQRNSNNLRQQVSYDYFLNILSKNLQEKYNQEMRKPIEERDPSFQARALAFEFDIAIISILNSFAVELEENAKAVKTEIRYETLYESSKKATLDLASNILGRYELYADFLSPNHPSYDTLRQVLQEAQQQALIIAND